MIKYLEKLLYQKTEGTQSEILFAQWNYDKKVIPTALNAVSNLFPHYSLHDESHSITIINNIVRVLGKDKIENLSAIDIWLILEASYSHDIGMVVSNEKLVAAIQSDDFISFFKDIQQDKKNGLYEFAIQFKIDDKKIKYNSNEISLDYHDGIKFILAEYFRRQHADRSKSIILNPEDELALSSPRGVIPKRIFKILADICASHTKDFDDVMKLPFCEVGIDIEDSHPRFISCLLRIGDLLDLDNNRFSEVMLRTLSKIPIDTINHKAKHLSIESFRVDNEIIEVKALCLDYDTANITQHWFNYLNSEISKQMINWNIIVPFKEFGYLPTIGSLKVELLNYDFIDGKKKPKFSVDTDKALELLQGAGIYEGAYQCIREILQNAVDATLLKIWLEYKGKSSLKSPTSIIPIIKKENIFIKVELNEKDIVDEYKSWEIIISDMGIGLSSNDLSFLMNTGSSSKNKHKSEIIDMMPFWLRPSGNFGIGFQSIFMLTDQVNIETKSYFNEEFQVIELNSPNSKKDGSILIKKKKTDHSFKPGTKLKFEYKTRALPTSWSIKAEHSNASRISKNFDPFSHDSLDIEIGTIFDEVFDFSKKSYIPIKLFLNGDEINILNNEYKFQHFDEEYSLELDLYTAAKDQSLRTNTYYKNQKAENNLHFQFLGFNVNIHKPKASEVLTLNRNKIKYDFNDKLTEAILISSFKVITSKFHDIFKDEESKSIASMYLHYYQKGYDFLSEFELKKFNQWENLKISVDNKEMELKKILSNTTSVKITKSKNYNGYYEEYSYSNKILTINLKSGRGHYDYTHFIIMKFKECMHSVQKNIDSLTKTETILFTKKITPKSLPIYDIKQIIENVKDRHYSSRVIIPCNSEFYKLRLKDQARENYVYMYKIDHYVEIPYPKMLSPFIKEHDQDTDVKINVLLNDKLLNWVYKNRYDQKTTLDEIKTAYKDFIDKYKFDNTVK